MYKYLEIKSYKDNEVVCRVEVTGMTERSIDRVEMGMEINLNHDDYFININDSEKQLEKIDTK